MYKRAYDMLFASLGLLLLWPALLVIAVAIKLLDRGPVLFRQTRVGWRGRPFVILKFRTMIPPGDSAGVSVTQSGDSRVTPIGRILRRTKLDELPQLWNVLKGDMSLVGPRPEVPRFVECYTADQRRVLELKPGITDFSTLRYRDEEALLEDATDVEQLYMSEVMPRKIELALAYARHASLWEDTKIILQTLFGIGTESRADRGPVDRPAAAGHPANNGGAITVGAGRKCLDLASPLPLWTTMLRSFQFLVVYSLALTASLWVAYLLRFDLELSPELQGEMPDLVLAIVPLQLGFLYLFRQFHFLPAYFGVPALMRMGWAMACSAALLGLLRWNFDLGYVLPFGVILLDSLLGLVSLSVACYVWRLYRHERLHRLFGLRRAGSKALRRVGIIGAGRAGVALAQELLVDGKLGLNPVAFFDDDQNKWQARILEVPVLGPPELLSRGIAKKYELDEVILSMPAAPTARIKEVLDLVRRAGLTHRTVPSLGEMVVGRYEVTKLRHVEIEDLLGREPVFLQTDEIRHLLKGRRVMVTGAGGSIGSELCRQAAAFGVAELSLVERCEVQLFKLEQELIGRGHAQVLRPLVADILDESRMRWIFDTYKPELVFHAAAHKHVPMMESQPEEAIQNNAFGTALVANLSLEFGVERFVLISTDKAINPTSVMGASKRLAEMILQDLQARNPAGTRLSAVRFGNVLGSSGSVVPLFKHQIANGGPVTVTHKDMTRYFMTIPEAVGLVLQSTVQSRGGDIFVLDMGQPVRILDLAQQMIQLHGLEPGKDIEIKITGVRPGEKLFEEISYSEESVTRTTHPKIMRLRGTPPRPHILEHRLGLLARAIHVSDAPELKRLLEMAVPEYRQRGRVAKLDSLAQHPASLSTAAGEDRDGNGKIDHNNTALTVPEGNGTDRGLAPSAPLGSGRALP